jgi:NADP-dependent 3-hydroxy acid dehydrogenase YdfG
LNPGEPPCFAGDHGVKVIAACRSPETALALKGLGVRVERLDTTDESTVQALVKKLKADGVTIDVLINNAGIATNNHPVDPIVEAKLDDVNLVFSTNVVGTIRATNAVISAGLMEKSPHKMVVNLSSDLGSITNVNNAQSAKVGAIIIAGDGADDFCTNKAHVHRSKREACVPTEYQRRG